MKSMHDRSSDHRAELAAAGRVACFYCGRRLPVSEIPEWIDDGQTALCQCGIDAVLPDPDDAPISEDTLRAMRDYWFWPVRWEAER
jgi:hypothetical protein